MYLAFLAKYPPKVLTKISATGMVEAALAPLHIKGGSPCEYPHMQSTNIVHFSSNGITSFSLGRLITFVHASELGSNIVDLGGFGFSHGSN